jgi:hypothetical protein
MVKVRARQLLTVHHHLRSEGVHYVIARSVSELVVVFKLFVLKGLLTSNI